MITSSTTSTVFRRCSANSTSICSPRATISRATRSSARIRWSHDGVEGVAFAVWAPNAQRVSVVGDFNGWDGRRMPMRKRHAGGFWELFVPGLRPGHLYKYEILGADGELLPLKADPHAEQRRAAARHRLGRRRAVAPCLAGRRLDGRARAQRNDREAPISIYEVHLGSWRRNSPSAGRYLSYRELAEQLVPYVADIGFTHIEVMPVTEYPFDGSWGYQPISLFAPTAATATPDDFRAFVDACHRAGLGAVARLGAGAFPDRRARARPVRRHRALRACRPAPGPAPRLEHADLQLRPPRGRRISCCRARSTGCASIISTGSGSMRSPRCSISITAATPGEWIPNVFGGRENLEAIAFLRRMNELVFGEQTGATTAAEESTAWPMVSRPTYVGGLGFGFKWNMGWMHDTLRYMSMDPIHRKYHHNDLTFGLLYAFHENFILPLSHDEVVHGKGSLIGKMPGDRWQRFANLRAYFAFMWTHPGKKLLFMGGEFGQEREWNHDIEPRLAAARRPVSRGGAARSCATSTASTARTPALHRLDCEPAGLRLDRRRQWRREHPLLSAARPRSARAGGHRLQFHAGAAPATTASACRGRALTASASTPTRRSMAAAASAMPARSMPSRIRCTAMPIRYGSNLPPLGV